MSDLNGVYVLAKRAVDLTAFLLCSFLNTIGGLSTCAGVDDALSVSSGFDWGSRFGGMCGEQGRTVCAEAGCNLLWTPCKSWCVLVTQLFLSSFGNSL